MPEPRPSPGLTGRTQLRQMALLLETAAVLEARARRATDPVQVAVLLRRAEQRRRDAGALREQLAARGAALAPALVERRSAPSRPLARPSS